MCNPCQSNSCCGNCKNTEPELWYDSKGNLSVTGAFDAAGHFYLERVADAMEAMLEAEIERAETK